MFLSVASALDASFRIRECIQQVLFVVCLLVFLKGVEKNLQMLRIMLQSKPETGHIKSSNGFGWKQLFKTFQSDLPAMVRYIFQQMRLPKASSSLTLNTSGDGTSTSSLGNLFQCLTTLIDQIQGINSSLNLPSFCLKLLRLVLSLRALVKCLSLSFL